VLEDATITRDGGIQELREDGGEWHLLKATQVKTISCQRKRQLLLRCSNFPHPCGSLASRIGLSANAFSNPGFRLALEIARAFPVLPPSRQLLPALPSAAFPDAALPPRRLFQTPFYLLHPWSRASMQSYLPPSMAVAWRSRRNDDVNRGLSLTGESPPARLRFRRQGVGDDDEGGRSTTPSTPVRRPASGRNSGLRCSTRKTVRFAWRSRTTGRASLKIR